MGAVLFLFFIATFKSSHIDTHLAATWIDTAVFGIFLTGAVFCLMCSATYHMATCHSKNVSRPVYTLWPLEIDIDSQVADQCHAFDYTGIIVLIVGSFFPYIYYGFFCEPKLQAVYLIAITLTGFGQFVTNQPRIILILAFHDQGLRTLY
jgi:adiponectin receptor